jgi:hypothetical protein
MRVGSTPQALNQMQVLTLIVCQSALNPDLPGLCGEGGVLCSNRNLPGYTGLSPDLPQRDTQSNNSENIILFLALSLIPILEEALNGHWQNESRD